MLYCYRLSGTVIKAAMNDDQNKKNLQHVLAAARKKKLIEEVIDLCVR